MRGRREVMSAGGKERIGGRERTLVGNVDIEVLAFTAARDSEVDRLLVEADCLGTAAHVTMLSSLRLSCPLITARERDAIVAALSQIIAEARAGNFRIKLADHDVHLAIERTLTRRLGIAGRKIHAGRSRNDQVAVDLRLYAKEQLLDLREEVVLLCRVLLGLAGRYRLLPMVGRTHLQPAMPGSLGLWASAHAESLLDDLDLLLAAYELNDRSPLGAAAGYGVPLPIDRQMTSRLLGFSRPIHNVLYAVNSRGKCEATILAACGQVMLSLSRLAEDLILYSMPEFGYFILPAEMCTGSSIMPQKKNPDVLELIRARAHRVHAAALAVAAICSGLPSGYNRDVQETKEPLVEGLATTRAAVRVMTKLLGSMQVCERALRAAFTPQVFAADRALELVAGGMAFRDAYVYVKKHLDEEVQSTDPDRAVAAKRHEGAPAGLDLKMLQRRAGLALRTIRAQRRRFHKAISCLLGVSYPLLTRERQPRAHVREVMRAARGGARAPGVKEDKGT
ncbi:MAG: argininosuccinate lyase [Kiritimatiellae bacterium]|nr:argininosuccinate lyase [Kiritimatiellia bacterium]